MLLLFNSFLEWERPFDPVLIFGGTTVTFLFFWYMDLSVLTTLAFLGMFAAMGDYFVPILSAQFIRPDYWTANKERKLEKICKELAVKKLSLTSHAKCFVNMRNEQPMMVTLFLGLTMTFKVSGSDRGIKTRLSRDGALVQYALMV